MPTKLINKFKTKSTHQKVKQVLNSKQPQLKVILTFKDNSPNVVWGDWEPRTQYTMIIPLHFYLITLQTLKIPPFSVKETRLVKKMFLINPMFEFFIKQYLKDDNLEINHLTILHQPLESRFHHIFYSWYYDKVSSCNNFIKEFKFIRRNY